MISETASGGRRIRPRKLVTSFVLSFFLFTAALGAIVPLAYVYASSEPSISIATHAGTAGSADTVSGRGFTASHTVTVTIGSASLACSDDIVASDGSFTCAFSVPPLSASGNPYIVAATDSAGVAASANGTGSQVTFTVVAQLTINPTQGLVGNMLVLTGSGFTSNETVRPSIGWTGGGCHEGPVTVGNDGSFTCTVGVMGYPAGQYAVAATTDGDGTINATSPFTVVTPSVTLTPAQGPVGTSVTIIGANFTPGIIMSNMTYGVDMQTQGAGLPQTGEGNPVTGGTCNQGVTHSDASGEFSCTFTIPSSTLGLQSLLVTGSDYSFALDDGPADWASANFTVTAVTSTSVSCSPSSILAKGNTTCAATVTGSTPSGTVVFTANSGFFSPSATCTLASGGCSVSFVAPSSAGSVSVAASYSGDAQNQGSTSSAFSVTVSTLPTSGGGGGGGGGGAGGGGGGGAPTSLSTIQLTGQPGLPTATFQLSGCNINATTVLGSGQAFTFKATASCVVLVAALPLPNSDTRFVFANGVAYLDFVTCPSAGCGLTANYWYQVQSTYQIVARAQPTFDPALSFVVSGTSTGTPQTICFMSTGAAPTTVCSGWSDANTQASLPTFTTGSSGRWHAPSGTTFTDSAPLMHVISYYKQYQLTVIGGNSIAYSVPSPTTDSYWNAGTQLTVTSSGIWGRSSGSGFRLSSWNVGTLGATIFNQGTFALDVSISSPVTVTFGSVRQYQLVLVPSAAGNLTSFPASTLGDDDGWYDQGTQVAVQFAPSSVYVGASITWASQDPGSYTGAANPTTVVMNGPITESIVTSLRAVIALAIAPANSGPPAAWKVSGCGIAQTIIGDGSTNKLSVPSSCALTVSFANSGTERYLFADGTSSATITACAEGLCPPVTLRYYFQNALDLSYKAVGGTPISSPALDYVSFGTHASASFTPSGARVWLDIGTTWSMTSVIQGTHSDRWATPAKTQGAITEPATLSPVYYHQFLLTTSFSVLGGGVGFASPVLWCTSEAAPSNNTLTGSNSIWADANTGWWVTGTRTGGVAGEEWLPQGPTSGNTTSAENIQLTYQHLVPALITEKGLPSGFTWSIVLGGKSYSMIQPTTTLLLPPGTYYWSISTPIILNSTTVFTLMSSSGILDLNSGGATLTAGFSKQIVAAVQVNRTTASVTTSASSRGSSVSALVISNDPAYYLLFGIAVSAAGTDFAFYIRAKRAFSRKIHEFIELLKTQGYSVMPDTSLQGKSGVAHHVDVLAQNSKGKKIVGMVGHGKETAVEIISTFVVSLDGNAEGCYIAPRKLDEQSRKLAESYKITLLV